MQHAVDAVADAQVVFQRFDVDIRAAVVMAFPDDLVDEFDDAGFLVEIAQVADGGPEVFVEIELVAGDEAVEGIGADAVELLGGLFDVGGGGQGELDAQAGSQPQGVGQAGRNGSLVATRNVPFSMPTGMTLYWKTALVGIFSRISPGMG